MMKKNVMKVIGGIVLVGGLLVGCGNPSDQTAHSAPKHKTEQVAKTDQWKQDQSQNQNTVVKADQPKESVSVVKTIVTNKAVNMNPIQLNIDSVTIKKAVNVAQDEIQRLNDTCGYQLTGNSFNYISINYTAKNTSPKNINFGGITKVVVIAGDHQEVVDQVGNIVTDDPNSDGVFYGQVTKKGNDGFITSVDPTKITKIILTVNGTAVDQDFQTITPDTDITFIP